MNGLAVRIGLLMNEYESLRRLVVMIGKGGFEGEASPVRINNLSLEPTYHLSPSSTNTIALLRRNESMKMTKRN